MSAPSVLAPARRATGRARRGQSVRPVVGVLPDGTAHYAPLGVVRTDGDTVCCHLCGRWFRSVSAHLRSHGWTKADYCDAFGLLAGQRLEGRTTSKRRAAAFTPRLVFEAAIRDGSRAGHERARAGDLAQDAARAARGRPHPEQRRLQARQGQAAIDRQPVVEANRRRGVEHRAAVAADVAGRFGSTDLGSFVAARRAAGLSLAAIEREAGLPKDWLSRHLRMLDPAADTSRPARQPGPDRRWGAVAVAHGFADAGGYLTDRHLHRRWTVAAIAADSGQSRRRVADLLEQCGIPRTAHARSRARAVDRERRVAGAMGFPSTAAYVEDRRAAGRSWASIARECGQPATWLQRRTAPSG